VWDNETQSTNTSKCPECGGTQIHLDNTTGETICEQCGVVISSTSINTGPEWRAFEPSQRENRPRTGAPASLMIYDKGLSTNIGWRDRDASGRELSQEAKMRLRRLRKWHQRSRVSNSHNRNLSQALNILREFESKLNLPRNVVETASYIYRNALKHRLIRGRTIKIIVAACTYMACRQCGVIRSLDEVARVSGVPRKDVARNYRFLVKQLGSSVPQVDARSIIAAIISKLGLSGVSERIAYLILEQASKLKLTVGRGPGGVAAACVYIAARVCGEYVTQGSIAFTAQVTEVTVRNRYKELVKQLDITTQL